MIYTNENWKPPVTYCEPNKVEVQRMNKEEAIKILRDTPIDIRSTREDDIHTLYATAQCMAIEALEEIPKRRKEAKRWKRKALQAEPKHGEWIFNPTDAIDLMFAKPKCSKCGFESSDGGNFCPNCGSRMNKEKEE